MDFLTNKKTGEAFPLGSSGVSSSEFHQKDSDIIESTIHLKDSEMAGMSFEEIGDTGDESLYKIKDLVAKPEIGDKVIPSDLYVKITNMLEATGDKQFEKEPYFAELILLPKIKEFSKEALEKVADSAGITTEELLSSNYAPMDIVGYGYSIRLAQKSGSDAIKMRNELIKDAPAHATMIGFDLDKSWNRMGENGWDSLSKMTGHKL